jgi:hypothetical protein
VSESDEPDEEWWKPEGLAALVPVPTQLLDGDLSAAYVAWLLAVQTEGVDDESVEPPVPPGLAVPSAPLVALADFLRVDRHLLGAAREGVATPAASRGSIARWVAAMPAVEKDRWLVRAVERPIGQELLTAFPQQGAGAAPDSAPQRRRPDSGG